MGLPGQKELEEDGELLAATLPQTEDSDDQDEDQVPRLRVGSILGGCYRVIRKLGQGGMGTVYVVEHTELGRRFAAKVVSRSLSESAIQRLLNEGRLTSGLDHENIVDVVNLGREPDGSVFVIMELLEGEDLGQRLDRQLSSEEGELWIPHPELVEIVPQMLAGLTAAHDAGIIHRDLKPENVFLSKKDDVVTVKLLDFGIAKNVQPEADHRLTRTGQIIGTPLYMAPEQARKMSDADHRSDIYSIGVILYEMVTAAPPFEADTLFGLIVQHATQPPVAPRSRRPGLPEPVELVILRCLEKSPEGRFDSVRELQSAWDAAWRGIAPEPPANAQPSTRASPLGRETVEQTPVVLPVRPVSAGQGRAKVLLGVGGLVLLLAGIGVWVVSREPAAPDPEPIMETSPTPEIAPPEPELAPEPEPVVMISRILTSEPQGATVTLAGALLGTTPLAVQAPEDGEVSVVLTLDGYVTSTVVVAGDSSDRLEVPLERDRPIRTSRGGARPSRPRPAVQGEPAAGTPTPPPRPRSSGQILLGMESFEAEQGR